MTEAERLAAIETIRTAKARYFRGVDTGDDALVRSVLAEDCVLDHRGCCTDPVTGRDFMPAMNMVLRGRSASRAAASPRQASSASTRGIRPRSRSSVRTRPPRSGR